MMLEGITLSHPPVKPVMRITNTSILLVREGPHERRNGGTPMTATLGYVPEFAAADVCDRCGRGATLRVIFPDRRDLLFCRYHAARYRALLRTLDVELEQGPE
jgi:hypothetical protein